MYKCLILAFLISIVSINNAQAQKVKTTNGKPLGKYPSIFWEITGNGLKKPSYLFGTMHVSMKLAFNLSDSFYTAMQSVDMVALELNPQHWQSEMMDIDAAQKDYGKYYMQQYSGDFLNEHSFQLNDYYENLEEALTSKPQQINGLLYRSFAANQDYEEDTYLDLYLYQTGRKYGKLAGGVEDYKTTQIILTDAYVASIKEKNVKTKDTDGESAFDIQKKIKEAYRKGDLDALDSLNQFENNSPAYTEYFLYKRNEIQVASIDSLLKMYSLFTGVGAAHLPGSRGVIELLRKKGYKLRPIFMQDRDAAMKETVDKMNVPVIFHEECTEDGFIKVQVPGKLYKLNNSFETRNPLWQYADMENGAYYMITRVKTHGVMLGQKPLDVMDKIDSLLYENIPGKILSKKEIVSNGYPGFDISNKTRRGDLQRYQIIVTPFEIIVFKMSGIGNYAAGDEASSFFNSIDIKPAAIQGWSNFTNNQCGFKIDMPHNADVTCNALQKDDNDRWEYEAYDETTGNGYFVWKKHLYNYNFLEEDSFDVRLITESFMTSECIEKEISSQKGFVQNAPSLKSTYALKGGGFMNTMAVLNGNQYFLIGERATKKSLFNTQFFSSFSFADKQYGEPKLFSDTLLGYTVQTSSLPKLDSFVSSLVTRIVNDKEYISKIQGDVYWADNRYTRIFNDSTGDELLISTNEFPIYFQSKDSATFWKNELEEASFSEDWVLRSKEYIQRTPTSVGYKLVWVDTNTIRRYEVLKLLSENKLYSVIAIRDSNEVNNQFLNEVFNSFTPIVNKQKSSVFEPKLDTFFAHLYSTDTLVQKKARASLSNIYYGKDGIGKIEKFIKGLKYGEKDYFGLKSSFINEMGYISDTCCGDEVVKKLVTIYNQTADTGYFQNEVFEALVRLKTATSFDALKKLLLQDPPVFNNDYDYTSFFESMNDSIPLARTLFPELMQLSGIQDYKQGIFELLATLVDSGYIKAADYKDQYNPIWIDAKIEMKKQQNNEERLMEKEIQDENDSDEDEADYAYDYGSGSQNYNDIDLYARLLIPFYKENPQLSKMYQKLLTGRDTAAQIQVAVLLAANGFQVPDSVWNSIAAKDKYRYELLKNLEDKKLEKLYPAKRKDQVLVARSALLYSTNADKFEEIELVGKKYVESKQIKGWVYFFRYKMEDDEDWQMGISGIQPTDLNLISSNNDFTTNTDKKLVEENPALEQFEKELKKLLIMEHRSGAYFYDEDYAYDEEEYYGD